MFHTGCSASGKLNLVAQEALCSCVVVGKSTRELYNMDLVPRVPGTNCEWFDW